MLLGGQLPAMVLAAAPARTALTVTIADAFSPLHRIYTAQQICGAMEYLESMRVVHADLFCRTCLLFHFEEDEPSTVVAKVTDLGLTVQLPQAVREETRKQPQAVRWCVPETVAKAMLSFSADVRSLGVTLWELFSGGQSPWVAEEHARPTATKLAEAFARILEVIKRNGADDSEPDEVAQPVA